MPIRQLDALITGVLVALGVVQLASETPDRAQVAAILTLLVTGPVLVRRAWPAM